MNRVVVVGPSGSGKTTLAGTIADHLGCEPIELDSIFHQLGWTSLPEDEFVAAVFDRIAAPTWVADGNYQSVADLLWDGADTVVWLDLPRMLVMGRVVRRTLRRLVTRQQLWNGNRERLRDFLSRDPERNLLRWTWLHHGVYRDRYSNRSEHERWARVRVVRLTTRVQVRAFVASLASRPARP